MVVVNVYYQRLPFSHCHLTLEAKFELSGCALSVLRSSINVVVAVAR